MSAPDYDSDRGDEISEKTNLNLQRRGRPPAMS